MTLCRRVSLLGQPMAAAANIGAPLSDALSTHSGGRIACARSHSPSPPKRLEYSFQFDARTKVGTLTREAALVICLRKPVPHQRLRLPGNVIVRTYLWAWKRHAWMRQVLEPILKYRDGAVVDIGANVGQTLVDMLHLDPRRDYLAFEPNPRCVRYLQYTVRSNSLTSCTVVPVALWDRFAIEYLHTSRSIRIDPGASLLQTLRPKWGSVASPVLCISFDELSEKLGLPHVAIAKVDVEGAELEVLQGMATTLDTARPPIVCEVLRRHRRADHVLYEGRSRELWAILRDLRYEVYSIKKFPDSFQLVRISAFPSSVWRLSNRNECDYLFLPKEQVPSYSSRITLNGTRK